MPEYLTPGVYIEEVGVGRQPIAATPTSTAAFVGATPAGPLNKPVTVRSDADYRGVFVRGSALCPVSMAVRLFFMNGGKRAYIVRAAAAGGRRKSPIDAKTVIGDAAAKTGIHALPENEPPGLLLTPDAAEMGTREGSTVAGAALKFCEAHRIFYILEPPRPAWSARDRSRAVLGWAERSAGLWHPSAAVYFPRVLVYDPAHKTGTVAVSPGGAVAGVFARTDKTRGVWKAPAGLEAHLLGVEGPEIDLTDEEKDRLQDASINPLRRIDPGRTVAWGARTFEPAGSDSEWRYVPVRRLLLFIEESINKGIQWAVFEPNDEPLWAQIRLAVSSFMNQLFRAGVFQGATSREAYFVKCSRETMTQVDIDCGRVVLIVGVAPLKPAEFIALRIELYTAK